VLETVLDFVSKAKSKDGKEDDFENTARPRHPFEHKSSKCGNQTWFLPREAQMALQSHRLSKIYRGKDSSKPEALLERLGSQLQSQAVLHRLLHNLEGSIAKKRRNCNHRLANNHHRSRNREGTCMLQVPNQTNRAPAPMKDDTSRDRSHGGYSLRRRPRKKILD
jgi:hypothetical protein